MDLLYAATSNAGKLRDFAAAARSLPLRIEPLPGLAEIPAPDENAMTFIGNARAKAAYYSRFAPGELVIADDSGLEVDALDGRPGVHSARFSKDAGFAPEGVTGVDQRNNLYLLERLTGVPASRRAAHYRCVLVAARDGVCLFTGEGIVEGEILDAPRGSGGFGYDPLFFLAKLNKTMAEIDLATKHKISHRGNALRALLEGYETSAGFLDAGRNGNQ